MNKMSARKTRLGFVLLTAWILGAGSTAVSAGEITGNGKSLKNPDGTLNGKSACAFSGREDTPGDPLFRGSKAQSWGQIPKSLRDVLAAIGLHPGQSCNPTKAAGEP